MEMSSNVYIQKIGKMLLRNISIIIILVLLLLDTSSRGMDVDTSGKICQDEIDYIKKRKPTVKRALENFIGERLPYYPQIGLCFSGGGYRAMIGSLGGILGASKIGLFDATTYVSSLSGSTWNIGALFLRNFFLQDKNFLKKFKKNLQDRVSQNFWNLKNINWLVILTALLKKLVAYETIKPADVWGTLVVDRVIGDLPQGGQNLSFENIRSFLEKTKMYPFPLFSTVIKDTFSTTKSYEWFEITPFTSGSQYLDGFISTKNLGSKFKYGTITQQREEEHINFLFGIFGSPYDFNAGDILLQIAFAIPENFPQKNKIVSYTRSMIKKYKLTKKNFLPSKIDNPTYKMPSSPYAKKTLTLADAGFELNLSMPPLLRRKTNIIICCDDSTDACKKGFPEMKLAKQYADKHQLPFPSIDHYKQIDTNAFVFKWDKNKERQERIPTVIYFTNPISESTLKLQYSKKEFNTLCGVMKNLVISNQDKIKREIVEFASSKKRCMRNKVT